MEKDTTQKPISALGRKVTTFEGFDTFPRPAGIEEVTCHSDEVTANCPVTEQPDWYTVIITYAPDKLCVESKTLKLYLQSFRNDGRFCESFADKIAEDLYKALSPHHIRVVVVQKPRGGIAIEATATRARLEGVQVNR